MKPDKTSIFDLFYNQHRFEVPLYQRPYVWSLDAQWRPLWEDIEDKALAVLNQQTEVPHFLGAIVTGQRPIFGNRISSWDIIDGQQRLTTLQIVLKAFRDVMNAQPNQSNYELDLRRITINEGLMEVDDEQFKVWPTNSDRSVFRDIMKAGAIDKVIAQFPAVRGRRPHQSAPKLAEAYVFFYRAIERFLNGRDDETAKAKARGDALFNTFRRYLQVVNIQLEAGDDPQVIFESLNGRGVALLASDLVRNLVFMRASSSTAQNADALYEHYWKQYDEARFGNSIGSGPWWKEEERQGRLQRPRLDLFVFYYVQYRTQQEVNIGHLFQEFRKWWEKAGAPNPADALADMRRYSEAFRHWLEPDSFGGVDEFCRWLAAMDTATVYPLLFLLLVEKSDIAPVERDGMIADLESFLVRRAVCGLTNKAYNRFFMALMRKIRSSNSISRASLRAELVASRGDSTRWPDDEEFGRAFVHRPAYQVIRRPIITKLLDSLERCLIDQFNNEVEITSKLSIEHIMPQDWKSNWPLDDTTEDAAERREHTLQTFGNLTLVTPQFNTKLSNRKFETKKREIALTSRLLLNHRFSDSSLQAWDETAIRLRSRELFDLARKRWPHPTSPKRIDDLPLDLPPDSKGRIMDDDEPMSEPAIDVRSAESLLDDFSKARAAQTESIGEA